MAPTYPLEVALAARWSKAHPNLKGDDAVKVVQNESWDVSVKSLVAFPQILAPTGDKLDWTQKLGDAFLAQQKEVFNAVQRLRVRAQQAGHLKSGPQQTVTVETATSGEAAQQTIVRIEPADPQVIYVPVYNPAIVYGGWGYAGYPYYYWPPYAPYYPGDAFVGGIAWGIGLGGAIAYASKFEGGRWQHDARHRQGVAYRDNATRERYGRSMADAAGRNNFRGRDATGAGTMASRAWAVAAAPCSVTSIAEARACVQAPAALAASAVALAADEVAVEDVREPCPFGVVSVAFLWSAGGRPGPVCIQGTRFYAGDYENAQDADIIVITAAVGVKPGQTLQWCHPLRDRQCNRVNSKRSSTTGPRPDHDGRADHPAAACARGQPD